MSCSVSSERAFSQGGITISKRRSRLKGDIVEALQCLKCLLRHDLLFQAVVDGDSDDEGKDDGHVSDVGDDVKDGWDCFVEDDSDDGFNADDEYLD